MFLFFNLPMVVLLLGARGGLVVTVLGQKGKREIQSEFGHGDMAWCLNIWLDPGPHTQCTWGKKLGCP